jgi:hypothetical protein
MTNTTSNQALAERIERLVQEHIAATKKSAQEAVERAFAAAAGARPAQASRGIRPTDRTFRGPGIPV